MPNRISRLFRKIESFEINDYKDIRKLADIFEEWTRWNRSPETIEVIKSNEFDTIIVVHNLFDDFIKVTDSWEFIKDVKYFLQEYGTESKEYLNYMLDFWEEEINGVMN